MMLAMSLLAYTLGTRQVDMVRTQIHANGFAVADLLAASVTELVFTDDHFALQVINNHMAQDANVLGSVIYDETGQHLAEAGDFPNMAWPELMANMEVDENERRFLNWHAGVGVAGTDVVSFLGEVTFDGVVGGYVLVTFSRGILKDTLREVVSGVVVTALILASVLVLIAFAMSRRIAKPIHALVAGAGRIAEGKFTVKVEGDRADELGQLISAFNQMAEDLEKKQRVETVLSHFVAGDVAKEMLESLEDVSIGGKKVDATVLFVDIVGFTSLSESLNPEDVADFLNEFFSYFTVCSHLFFGTVDKFIGDCAMVLFGAPRENPDHRYNAIACAVVMQKLLKEINARRQVQGKHLVNVRIGINSGEMMAGVLGTQNRMDYTVVGDAVNIASRLCNVAEPAEIVIPDSLYQAVQERVTAEEYQEVTVKGKTEPIHTWKVQTVTFEHQSVITALIDDILERGVKSMDSLSEEQNMTPGVNNNEA